MNTPRSAVAFLALLAIAFTPVRAGSAKVDFDQGADASQALREVRERVPVNAIDPARLLRAERADMAGTTDKGAVIGIDTRGRVEGSGPYQDAQQYPPMIENLKPEVRDPLKAQWSGVNSTRGELLSEANGLEAEDRALVTRAQALNRRTEELDRTTAQLDAEVANFNQQCTGRPLPPDQYNACVRWRDDLVRRVNAHNAEVQKHNAQVDQWRNEAADLRRRAGTQAAAAKKRRKNATPFLPRVVAWEQRVLQFSAAAKRALEEARCGPLAGLKIDPAAPSDLPVSYRQPFTAVPSFGPPEDKPCPITYLWTTQNTAGNIGSLTVSPNDQKQATLNTGTAEAKGFVIIEADEVLGKKSFRASTPVKVVKGAIQCKLVHYCTSQPPSPPPYENICNYDCCGETFSNTYLNNVCSPNVCATRFCVPGNANK